MHGAARWVGALLVGLIGLGAATSAHAQQAPTSVYLFRSGVWLDAERGRAYLMLPGTGVEAVDLQTGRALWREGEVQKPIWASGGRLLAQRMEAAERISLVMLDVSAEQPRELWRTSYTVPEGVRVSIDAGKWEVFHLAACERAGGLGLEWKFDEIKKPMWAVEPETEAMNRRSGASLLLDLASGKLSESAQDVCEPLRTAAASSAVPKAGSRTDAGRTVRYASADGRHYLASSLVPGATGQPRYTWEIRATGTDQAIAEIEQPLLAGWFVVRDELVIHDVPPTDESTADGSTAVRPPRIRAVRASSGAEVWSHEYRNTRFVGNEPPAVTSRDRASRAR